MLVQGRAYIIQPGAAAVQAMPGMLLDAMNRSPFFRSSVALPPERTACIERGIQDTRFCLAESRYSFEVDRESKLMHSIRTLCETRAAARGRAEHR